MAIFTIIFSNKFFLKSKKGNGFWTFLKMSNFRMTEKFPENTQKSRCDRDAHNDFLEFVKNVMLTFSLKLAIFYVSL